MKNTWTLLLLAGIFFAGTFAISNTRLTRTYNKAHDALEVNVEQAVAFYAPATEIPDYNTFGRSSRLHDRFYREIVESAIRKLSGSSFTNTDARNVEAAIAAVRRSSPWDGQQKLKAQERIVDAAIKSAPLVAQEGMLSDFDEYSALMERITDPQRTAVDETLFEKVNEIKRDLAKTDRYQVALRTVAFDFHQHISEGWAYMGVQQPPERGVVEVPPDASLRGWDFPEAEYHFYKAADRIHEFIGQWQRPLPPELARELAAAQFNRAMVRFMYTISTAKRNEGRWDYYFMKDYVPSGYAGAAEYRSNFAQDLSNNFKLAIRDAQRLPAEDPIRARIINTAAAAQKFVVNDLFSRDKILNLKPYFVFFR